MKLQTRHNVRMRASDLARLNEPYPENFDPSDSDANAALGTELPHWTVLETDILADFEEQPPYGIGWWTPGPGTSRRILIADQLYCCVASAADNMTEAALHWLEFLDASERDSARFADAVKMENGRLTPSPPRPRSPFEQLGPEFVRIHYAGIIRALASALDCLAGVIVGVAALPMCILRADSTKARRRLNTITGATNDSERMQAQFAASLEANIAAAGPSGWLDLDARVPQHAGPSRTTYRIWSVRTENPRIFTGPMRNLCCGPAAYGTSRVIPAGPKLRCFSTLPWTLVLSEEGERTLRGLFNSTNALLETIATDLLRFWHWRRDHPESLCQPAAQWPNGRSTMSTGFSGYAPGTIELEIGLAMTHPVVARRFRSAALDDPARPQWATFD